MHNENPYSFMFGFRVESKRLKDRKAYQSLYVYICIHIYGIRTYIHIYVYRGKEVKSVFKLVY